MSVSLGTGYVRWTAAQIRELPFVKVARRTEVSMWKIGSQGKARRWAPVD